MTESKKELILPKSYQDALDLKKCTDGFFHQLGRLSGMCDTLLAQAREASGDVDAHSALEAVDNVLTNASKMIIQVAFLKSHAFLWKVAAEIEAEKLEESIRTGQS